MDGPQGLVWKDGKSRPHRDSILDRPARSSVAKPTELRGPNIVYCVPLYTSRISITSNNCNILTIYLYNIYVKLTTDNTTTTYINYKELYVCNVGPVAQSV